MKGGVLTPLPLWAQTPALVVVYDLDAGPPAAQQSITQKGADRGPRAVLPGQQREQPGSPASDQATLLQLRASGLSGFFPHRLVPSSPPCLYRTSSAHSSGSTVPPEPVSATGSPFPRRPHRRGPLPSGLQLESALGKPQQERRECRWACIASTLRCECPGLTARSGEGDSAFSSRCRRDGSLGCSAGTGGDDVSDAAGPLNTALPFLALPTLVFLIQFYFFMYLGLVGLCCCLGFPPDERRLLSGCGTQAAHCEGFSLGGHTGSGVAAPGSLAPAQGLWCRTFHCFPLCGIFLDQGSNPHLLNWQADSPPLSHQGSSVLLFVNSLGCFCAKSLQSCPGLCYPLDCSP